MKAILNCILNAVERSPSVRAIYIATLLVFPFAPGNAQVPDTLKHRLSISPPRDSTLLIQEPNVTLDGDLLAFSTPIETIGGIQWAGGVRVFSASSGELLHVIPNPDPEIGDTFGRAVALSGTRLAVGAPRRLDPSGLRRGVVYVYELAGPTPTVPARILHCPLSIRYGEFGTSVALSGNQLAVGAPRGAPFDAQHLEGGFVFLYDLSSTSPETPWLSLDAPPLQGGRFGQSVALAGQTLVIGADQQIVEGIPAGAVFVYELADGTPSQVNRVLPNPVPAYGAQFGISVAISGSRIVIGCPGYSSKTGRAYVHDLSTTNPVNPVQVIEGPTLGHFGWHVDIEGTRIGIGAPGDPHLGLAGTLSIGRAFVYDIASPAPGTPVAILKPGSAPYEGVVNFGYSLAISGNTIAVADMPNYPPNDCFIYMPSSSSLFDQAMITAGLTGSDALPTATPFHDGAPNLLKYAFNLNLSGPDHRTMVQGGDAGLPHISRVSGVSPVFRIEYLRRLNAGLNYLPQTGSSLEAGDWEPVLGTPQITPVDASWERVVHEVPATADRMFGRVGVELGE